MNLSPGTIFSPTSRFSLYPPILLPLSLSPFTLNTICKFCNEYLIFNILIFNFLFYFLVILFLFFVNNNSVFCFHNFQIIIHPLSFCYGPNCESTELITTTTSTTTKIGSIQLVPFPCSSALPFLCSFFFCFLLVVTSWFLILDVWILFVKYIFFYFLAHI